MYDLTVYSENKSEFMDFLNYLENILLNYENDMLPHIILQKKYIPIYFCLLGDNDPFSIEDNNNDNILEQFYLMDELNYIKEKDNYKIDLRFFLYKRTIDTNDNFASWLLYLSNHFKSLFIKNYQNTFNSNFDYYDDILYLFINNNSIIDIYDINVEDYYLKKNGKLILNEGFFILYPIYKEIISKNPYYYSNYRYNFYKILRDPKIMFNDELLNESNHFQLIDKKYLNFRPLFIKFYEFLHKHKPIRNMIIDETTHMIGNFNERGLIKFQNYVKYKFRLKRIHEELIEISYLPPYTKEEFEIQFENKYLKIYNLGGALFREKNLSFYIK